MKILYIITKSDEIGGAQVHVRDLSIAMRDKRNEILIITGEKGELVNQLKENNLDVLIDTNLKRSLSVINDVKAFFSIRKKVKKFKPDVLALHSSKAGIIGRLVGKSLSIPTSFTVHGWAFADGVPNVKKKLYILIEKFFAKYMSDKIITVSEQDKKLALGYNVASNELMIPIQNGISVPKNNDITRVQHVGQPIKLIMVARFSEQKDHKTLFDALKLIDKSKWQLSLVGKGKLVDFYKTLARELGIDSNIKFLGERYDVPLLLQQSDIFLLISNWEGYPLSILEAMSFGLPVIASDVGGVSEAVSDSVNGYLIPRSNSKYLAEKLLFILEHPEVLSQISSTNIVDFKRYHTLDKMVEKTEQVYLNLLSS